MRFLSVLVIVVVVVVVLLIDLMVTGKFMRSEARNAFSSDAVIQTAL